MGLTDDVASFKLILEKEKIRERGLRPFFWLKELNEQRNERVGEMLDRVSAGTPLRNCKKPS